MRNALYQATALTFEELGFLFPEDEESPASAEQMSAVMVGFEGDEFNGKVVLKVCDRLLPNLAENMLGSDDIPSEELQKDVLGEFANVICGNVLPILAGTTAIFKLSPPKQIEFDRSNDFYAAPKADLNLSFEEGDAEVLLYLEE